MIILSRNKNICCGLKKVVAKSRARVYSEQQILALLFVVHQAHNLSRNKCARVLANQPIGALHFFNPQQFLFFAGQVDHARWKTRTIDQKLQRNNVARQVEGFCISYFAAFNQIFYCVHQIKSTHFYYPWNLPSKIRAEDSMHRHTKLQGGVRKDFSRHEKKKKKIGGDNKTKKFNSFSDCIAIWQPCKKPRKPYSQGACVAK